MSHFQKQIFGNGAMPLGKAFRLRSGHKTALLSPRNSSKKSCKTDQRFNSDRNTDILFLRAAFLFTEALQKVKGEDQQKVLLKLLTCEKALGLDNQLLYYYNANRGT